MTVHVNIRDIVHSLFGHDEAPSQPELTERQILLLQCYLSGQVPESAWQEHLRDEPVLAEGVAARTKPIH